MRTVKSVGGLAFSVVALTAVTFFMAAQSVSAHAVVTPNKANVGEFTNFSLGVPSEKSLATVGVRLLIPAGLQYITPFVKPGWTIQIKQSPFMKDGKPVMTDDGTPAQTVSEIDWTGGSVPAGEKDLFMFSAQVPTEAATLDWKVYQTYADGSMVSWDQDPNAQQPMGTSGKMDFSKTGPYSKTEIVNDLAQSSVNVPVAASSESLQSSKDSSRANTALVISMVSLILAVAATLKRPRT